MPHSRSKLLHAWVVVSALLLVGCACCGGSDQPSVPSAVDPNCDILFDRPYRGLALLHCNQTQARPNCEALDSAMVASCVQRLATNYLVNGTFGFVDTHMMHDINLLTAHGRKLDVTFYLLNGPGQRRFRSSSDPSYEVRVDPIKYRERIKASDFGTLAHYKANIHRVLPVVDFALNKGAVVRIVPMLEDNLDRESFEKLLEISRTEFTPRPVLFGRNPCNCYVGADSHTPEGVFKEQHKSTSEGVGSNTLVTNDGVGFEFPGESAPYPRLASVEQLASLMLQANALGSTFIFWNHSNQGLNSDALPPPASRHYKTLEQWHVDFYIDFLRREA